MGVRLGSAGRRWRRPWGMDAESSGGAGDLGGFIMHRVGRPLEAAQSEMMPRSEVKSTTTGRRRRRRRRRSLK